VEVVLNNGSGVPVGDLVLRVTKDDAHDDIVHDRANAKEPKEVNNTLEQGHLITHHTHDGGNVVELTGGKRVNSVLEEVNAVNGGGPLKSEGLRERGLSTGSRIQTSNKQKKKQKKNKRLQSRRQPQYPPIRRGKWECECTRALSSRPASGTSGQPHHIHCLFIFKKYTYNISIVSRRSGQKQEAYS